VAAHGVSVFSNFSFVITMWLTSSCSQVVTSVTYKTFSALELLEIAIFHTSPDITASKRFYTEFLSLWPALNDAELRGYSWPLVPNSFLPPGTTGNTGITILYQLGSQDPTHMNATLAPVFDWADSHPQDVNISFTYTPFPSFYSAMEAGSDIGIASPGNTGGSRLIAPEVFEKSSSELSELLYSDTELFSTLHLSECRFLTSSP
jgi:hypothetical protein